MSLAKIVEIRVHGVSGTPASASLGTSPELLESERAPEIELWRLARHDSVVAVEGDGAPTTVELEQLAYRWARLTSGKNRYALWLLLLPYTLVNVAGWMLPARVRADITASTDDGRPIRSAALRRRCWMSPSGRPVGR